MFPLISQISAEEDVKISHKGHKDFKEAHEENLTFYNTPPPFRAGVKRRIYLLLDKKSINSWQFFTLIQQKIQKKSPPSGDLGG